MVFILKDENHMCNVNVFLIELGEVEDEIFKKRRTDDVQFRQRNKDRRRKNRRVRELRNSFVLLWRHLKKYSFLQI